MGQHETTQKHGRRKKIAQVKINIEVLKQISFNEWTTKIENKGII
jgi:hypothetical protein